MKIELATIKSICAALIVAVAATASAAADPPCGDLLPVEREETPVPSPYTLSLADPAQFRLRPGYGVRSSAPDRDPEPANTLAKRPFATEILRAADTYKIDAELIHAVIAVESGYDPKAVSPKGARGLMQLMPDTARRYGLKDLRRPDCNIRVGAAYLKDLLVQFGDDVKLALAAYNAGENAVVRYGNRIPPYRETLQYVPKVANLYAQLKPPRLTPDPQKQRPRYSTPSLSIPADAFPHPPLDTELSAQRPAVGP